MRNNKITKILSQLRFFVIILLLLFLLNFKNPNSCVIETTSKNMEINDNPVELETIVTDYCGHRILSQTTLRGLTAQNGSIASNPLGSNTSLVLKLEELAIIGRVGEGWILEDRLHNFTTNKTIGKSGYISEKSYLIENCYWQIDNVIQAISTGQFDNDSEEEFVILDLEGAVVIYDDAKHNYTEKYHFKFNAVYCSGNCGDSTPVRQNSITNGDFDGDGIDELAMIFLERDWDNPWCLPWQSCPDNYDQEFVFRIFDINESVSKYTYSTGSTYWDINDVHNDYFNQPRLKAGDLDGDGKDEIVLTIGSPAHIRGWIFDESAGTYSANHTWTHHDVGREFNQLALGDVDGDYLDEILYIIKESGTQGESIYIKDDEIGSYMEKAKININEGGLYTPDKGGILECGDVDGDGFDEIITFSLAPGNTFGIVYDDYAHNYAVNKTWQPAELATIVGKELTLGDVDADGMDEIIFSTGRSIENWEPDFGLVGGNMTVVLDDAKYNYTVLLSDSIHRGFITTGDFDADGIQLQYTGIRWTTIAPPKVVMAIAAPPTYRGISQNYIGSYTAFGKYVSTGYAVGNSIGVSEGAHYSVGVDVGGGFIFEAEASFTFRKAVTEEFLRTNTKTRTELIGLGYFVGASEDAVIFMRTIFDNYKYEIIWHPTNPDAIGEFMTIDVPQTSGLWKVPVSYYNKEYGSIAPTIGSETFNHTVGKPWTYPNVSNIESIAPIRWAATQMQTVGLGDAAQTTSIEIEITDTSEMSRTFITETSYEFEGSMGVGCEYASFHVTAGTGWSSGSIDVRTSSFTVGESCVFEGSVGDIENPETWEKLKHSFSLIVYNLRRQNESLAYQVVNYIVDDIESDDPFKDVKNFINLFTNSSTAWHSASIVIIIGIIIPLIYVLIKKIKKRSGKKSIGNTIEGSLKKIKIDNII